jgi:uncharacterized membrane protein HdeD (DUF308 family)
MPVPRGKRNKGSRRRGQLGAAPTAAPAASTGTSAKRSSSLPIQRRRRSQPLWVNASMGAVMLVVGLYFFIFLPPKGASLALRIGLLLLYFALAGLYLGRALIQMRKKRQGLGT